jgi:methylated-DNA-[protein]-cysteine S-methyltransferase
MTSGSNPLRLDRVASPLGTLLVVCDGDGRLHALDFADHEARMRRLLRDREREGYATLAEGRAPAAVREALAAFFAGVLGAIDGLEVRPAGTGFQRRVWSALRGIPGGATTSYGALAAVIGRPSACRAVGLANGANPIVIVLPCHRVVGSDGRLTGYGGGIDRKRWLLDHERRWSRPDAQGAVA